MNEFYLKDFFQNSPKLFKIKIHILKTSHYTDSVNKFLKKKPFTVVQLMAFDKLDP